MIPWGLILKFVKSPAGIASVAAALLLTACGVQTLRLGWAQADLKQSLRDNGALAVKLDNANAAVDEAVSVNRTQTANVDALAQKIMDMVAQRASEAAQRAAEIAARDAALVVARRDADRLRRQINVDWSSTTGCQSLSALRVDTACPAIAQRVHDRTVRQGSDN
jgi:hypothetical protein